MEQDIKKAPELWVIALVVGSAMLSGFYAYDRITTPAQGKPAAVQPEMDKPDWGGEGTLLSAPAGGPDYSVTQYVEPGLISFVYEDEDEARRALEHLVRRGERVCLADLLPPGASSGGPRWWLFTC